MILIVGGTGAVGSRVTQMLIDQQQHQLRVLARGKSDWEGSSLPGFRRSGVEVIVGDLNEKKNIERALNGCKAIINCSGLMRSASPGDIEAVNIKGVENLVKYGKEQGVQRFIQISCVGATEHATNLYFRTKWQAEDIVRRSSLYWTIFRTSLIFGAGSTTGRVLDYWIERAPFVVVVGSGLNKFQPVSADDVAACVVQSVYARDTVNKMYDLVGPESIGLKEMLTASARASGRSTASIRIPSFVGRRLAALFGKLNVSSPIDGEVMSVFTSELVGDHEEMTTNFEVQAIPFSSSLTMSSGKSKARVSGKKSKSDEPKQLTSSPNETPEGSEEEEKTEEKPSPGRPRRGSKRKRKPEPVEEADNDDDSD